MCIYWKSNPAEINYLENFGLKLDLRCKVPLSSSKFNIFVTIVVISGEKVAKSREVRNSFGWVTHTCLTSILSTYLGKYEVDHVLLSYCQIEQKFNPFHTYAFCYMLYNQNAKQI